MTINQIDQSSLGGFIGLEPNGPLFPCVVLTDPAGPLTDSTGTGVS